MDIRDELITGSFMYGHDGRKEPPDWKKYAIKLEAKIEELQNKICDIPKLLLRASTLVGNPCTNISSSTDFACDLWQEDYKKLLNQSNDIDTVGKCANCGVEFHIHKVND